MHQSTDPHTTESNTSSLNTIEMDVGPDLHTTTLENGLEVVVVPDHRLPLVNVGMAVRTGATSESPETNGLAHLYEHMFFTANRKYSSSSAFENRQRELGIVSNAFTSEEAVVYYFSLPEDNLDAGVQFMSEAMMHPLLKEEELKQERKVVLDEFNTRTSRPSRRLSRAVDKQLFHTYPWRRSTLGEKEVIENASRKDMMSFKTRYYRPDNSVVLVVGDTTVDRALKSVKEQFSDWSSDENKTDDEKPPHPPIDQSKAVVEQADIQYATLLTKQFGPSVGKNPEATYAADIWGKMLSLSSSKFQQHLVDDGPFQNATMSYYTQNHGPTIRFQGVFRPEDRSAALEGMLREVRRFDDPGYFTKDQLEAAKNKLIVDRTFSVENGRDFLQSLGFWWSVAGMDYFGSYLQNLRDVSLEDVRAFCQKHVQNEHRVYGMLVPQDTDGVSPSSLLEQVENTQSRLSDQPEVPSEEEETTSDDRVKQLANRSFKRPETSGTEHFKLSNGIPVIHRRVTENEVLSIQLFLDGGTMNYREAPAGIETFLLRTMLRGSETYPLDQFQTVTDREGISLSTDSNYDFSRLSASGLVQDLPLALDLMEDAVKRPLLKKDQVEWVRKQLLTSVQQRRSNPRQQVWHVTNDVFFQNHPYRKNPDGTLESLRNIDRNDLTSYYDRLISSGRMLLTVVGRIPTARLKQQLENRFGTLPTADYERPEVPSFSPAAGSPVNITEQEGLSTAFITSKYPLPSMASPEYPALKLGLKVLSDRIYEETRTKRGLTYGAYAGLPYFRQNWGYLFITTPKPNLAMSLIFEEIHKIKREEIRPDELTRTGNVLYTRQLIERQTASSIGSLLGRYELIGNGWETFGDVLDEIRTLTPDRVRSVLNKHLDNYVFGAIQGPNMNQKIDIERLLNPEQARKALDNPETETSSPSSN